jgi:hypothetical protein
MKWIVGLGLGFTASEQFKPRNKDEDSNEKWAYALFFT